MKKYKFVILSCLMLSMLSACNQNNTTDINVPNDNDGVDVDVPVSVNIEPHSDVTSVSGNVENTYNENNIQVTSGDVYVNQGIEIKSQNINVYVDKVLTDLVDINGNVVTPFTDNAEIYVPLSSLGEILDKPVEYDRTNKAVYVGESPNRTTNMLDIVRGYDPQNMKEYSFSKNKGTEYFSMAGNDYTDGLVALDNGRFSGINFNLDGKYSHFNCYFGHLEGTDMVTAKLTIKVDGYVEKDIDVNPEDYPIQIDIDVTNAMQLRFEVDTSYYAGYAFTDMILT